jgi:hypothetical protein
MFGKDELRDGGFDCGRDSSGVVMVATDVGEGKFWEAILSSTTTNHITNLIVETRHKEQHDLADRF